jgi:type IV pilus assembly protein PilM
MSGFSFSLRDDRGPSAAVELCGHRVSAARLEARGGRPTIVAHASEAIPEGMIVASLTASNIRDRAGVLRALTRVLAEVGNPRRIGLVIPDPAAKVSLVKFQHVPPRQQDLDQLIRWQIRKTTPFPLDEAQVGYAVGANTPEGRDFVVSVARRDVILEYEALCADAGTHAGIVDLSTFNVVNATLATGEAGAADWLLVNVAPDWASLAILRGGDVIFLRSRGADGEGTLTDLVHQTAMYYEDRLGGGGFGRAFVCGAASAGLRHAADLDQLRQSLEHRLHVSVTAVDPRAAAGLTDRISATPALLDALTPLVGLLLRSLGKAA